MTTNPASRLEVSMDKEQTLQPKQERESTPAEIAEKKSWAEPKLTFVEPKLTRHGKLTEVTGQDSGGFFGGFSA
jgi:hypothetical protein